METHTNYLEKRFKGQKRVEPIIKDNYSIMAYKKCATYYFYTIVLGYRESKAAPYFAWGTALHKFLEYIETSDEAEAKNLSISMERAKRYFIEHKSETPTKGKWSFITEERFKLSCLSLFRWWMEEKNHGRIKVIGVEQPFNVEISPNRFLGGRADQIIQLGSDIFGRDLKTTSKQLNWFFSGLKPDHQFALYTWAESEIQGKKVTGQVIIGLYNENQKGPEVKTATVNFANSELREWKEDVLVWLDRIDKSREEDHYPRNETQCWNCPFNNVCKKDSEMGRLMELKGPKYVHKAWDHTTVKD